MVAAWRMVLSLRCEAFAKLPANALGLHIGNRTPVYPPPLDGRSVP